MPSEDNLLDQIMIVLKSELKADIRMRVRKHFPHQQNKITKRLINDTHIYIQGYANALKEYAIMPINKNEMQSFLFERAFEYIEQFLVE